MADPPVIERLRTGSGYFLNSIQRDGNSERKKIAFIMRRLMDEAIEDAAEVPPEIFEFYLSQATAVLHWIATGQTILNMPLPEDFTRNVLGVAEEVREIEA